jgi:hypothetical protein
MNGLTEEFFAAVIKRWRGVTAKQLGQRDESDSKDTESADAFSPQPAAAIEPAVATQIKRPVPDRLDISRAFQGPAKPSQVPGK